MKTYPTPWQKKTLWTAITAISLVAIGAVAVFLVWIFSQVMGFLQPLLVPFAVAGVLAYLLNPVVNWFVQRKVPRRRAVIMVFCVFVAVVAGGLIWVIPAISKQTASFASKVPGYVNQARTKITETGTTLRDKYGLRLPSALFPLEGPEISGTQQPARIHPSATPVPKTTAGTTTPAGAAAPAEAESAALDQLIPANWIAETTSKVIKSTWKFLISSIGVFGFLLSLVIVPLYLFYLLTETPRIADGWSNYLPLRASRFKDEVVDVLTEINRYLIAFFRGQLLVSVVNGMNTAILLGVLGVDFWLVIGLLVAILNIIPYIGIILCWIPAVIIAAVQTSTWLIPANEAWVLPLVVTGAFIFVQQMDGLFITPKIVGSSVGLHPMTVILSVFLWSLLLGGLLGAILAVPLTATVKVIFRRYIWEKRRITGREEEEDTAIVAAP